VVRFGRGFARAQFAVSLCGAFAAPFTLLATGSRPWCLLPLLAAPLAWSLARRLNSGKTPAELVALLGDAGKLLAIYAALFAAGVLL
jgi:1,4-dihydroxy-2-naphthoate octaprenyltransferase